VFPAWASDIEDIQIFQRVKCEAFMNSNEKRSFVNKVICREACTEGSEPVNPGSDEHVRAGEDEGGARSAGYRGLTGWIRGPSVND
jgi:hypothetical protein